MRLPWVSRTELGRSQSEYNRTQCENDRLRTFLTAANTLADDLRTDLAAERDRYERLVEKMADLQRAGFTSREPVRYQPDTPTLPEPVLAAIVARGGGLGTETGRLLTAYALGELAAGKTAEQVETAIWDGEGG